MMKKETARASVWRDNLSFTENELIRTTGPLKLMFPIVEI